MRLSTPFVQLPLCFDADEMAREVAAFPRADWVPHPQGAPGNSALLLVSHRGEPRDDRIRPPFLQTPSLRRSPALRGALASLGCRLGRTRLMRLEAGAQVGEHVDSHPYWQSHHRVHIPILTTPQVHFYCDYEAVHMPAGSAWLFDSWRPHNVVNLGAEARVHLVCDVADCEAVRALMDGRQVEPTAGPLPTEHQPPPVWLSADALQRWAAFVFSSLPAALRAQPARYAAHQAAVEELVRGWRALGERDHPVLRRRLLRRFQAQLSSQTTRLTLSNKQDLCVALGQLVAQPALTDPPQDPEPQAFDRPVFVVCPPRSGSSLLFETLARAPGVFTIGGEAHRLIEGVPGLSPRDRGFASNRLLAADATPRTRAALRQRLLGALRDRDGAPPELTGQGFRVLEKTPKNSLRVPLLVELFPDARFVLLLRPALQVLSSMLEGWRSGRFVTYPELPGWRGPPWSFALTPGWRELAGLPLPEVVAHQWCALTDALLDDLEALPSGRVLLCAFDALVADPQALAQRVAAWADWGWDQTLQSPLPQSQHTLTAPAPDKWRRNAAALERVQPIIAATQARVQALSSSALSASRSMSKRLR